MVARIHHTFHAGGRRFTQNSSGQSKIPLTVITVSTATTARVHHAARRRGGGIAHCWAGAAAGDAGDWVPGATSYSAVRLRAFLRGLQEAGADRSTLLEFPWFYRQCKVMTLRAASSLANRHSLNMSLTIYKPCCGTHCECRNSLNSRLWDANRLLSTEAPAPEEDMEEVRGKYVSATSLNPSA
jgi:hypothetical protein